MKLNLPGAKSLSMIVTTALERFVSKREAGGTVTDIEGRPLEFHHGRELAANRGVIVTNGRLHRQVLEAVRGL